MSRLLKRHWFLVALLILIPLGVAIGLNFGEQVNRFGDYVNARWITAIALFLMSFTLNSSQLKRSLASPGPVLLATAINFGLLPALALLIAPLQLSLDFQYGLMVAASSPCTMAAASVWTRQANGNDAVSLLVTLITNAVCVVVTPFWLQLGTGSELELGFSQMASRLLLAVLIPGFLGQLLRLNTRVAGFATKHKPRLSVLAMSCILMLVLSSSLKAGAQLASTSKAPDATAVLVVWLSCIGLHLVAMFIAWFACRTLRVSDFDRPAVLFASSQKTLPIGVMMATELANEVGVAFAVFPMLMFHASQLVIDTGIANRLRRQSADDQLAAER